MASRAAVNAEQARRVFVLEIERGVSRKSALRHIGWSESAYCSQRHRHRAWACEVDRAFRTTWANGLRGVAVPLDGRSLPGALQRSEFLELIRRGYGPWEARERLEWSGPAYYQSRYRHRGWAEQVDRALEDAWS